jgi:hypothetical protein
MYTIFLPNLVVCVWLYLTFCLWMVGVFVVLFTSTLWITSDVASPVIFWVYSCLFLAYRLQVYSERWVAF